MSNVGGEIEVQGTGKSLVPLTNTFAPLTKVNTLTGLQVQPGKTLALVGGNVVLKGGTLTAQGGRIEIGSVDSGLVKLNLVPEGWALGYEGVSTFKDIQLSQGALIDASGTEGGSVQVQGSAVKLTEGSVILIQNQGAQPSGSLVVKAVESLELNGASTDGGIPTTIRTQPISDGNGGDIVVRTLRLIVQDGAGINSVTYGSGKGGNVNVNTSNTIDVLRSSPIRASFNSNIAAYTFASGNAGNVTVSTENLTITNGGAVNSSSLGIGKGGEVTIDARNSVKITGANPKTLAPSLVGASAFNTGNAGTLTINTSKLVIEDGGAVSSVALASGSAGSVTINASDSVKLSGKLPDVVSAGTVSSSAYIADTVVQQIFKLPPKPSGRSGSVTINTENLNIVDGGLITVNNDGEGNAGNLVINANNILLENTGRISAATTSGEGGDIKLQTQNLQLTNNSSITATSNGTGNGGNIIINTSTLAAIKNSDITANAFKGSGGNIEIAAKGIFGIESRTRLTPLSDITASSTLGINGTVQIDTLNSPIVDTTIFPEQITQPPEITSICQANSKTGKNTFVTTGTGGIPPNPDNFLSTNSGWSDRSTLPQSENSLKKPLPVETTQVIEAQGWSRNPDGTVILTAEPTGFSPNSSQAKLGCKQTSSSRITNSIKDRNLK